jgi:hypothetical protein
MTTMISTLRIVTVGAMLTGTLLLADCGGSPERVTRTTTTEESRTVQPPPAVSTTTTTTEQIQQTR